MRLLSKVLGLEAALGASRRREPIGLVWTEDDVRVDVAALRADQHVALDIRIRGACGETPIWKTVERVTADPADLGVVYGESGAKVGRVVKVDGSLVEWVLTGRGDSAAG
jgi:hypothetical protein